MNIRIYLIEEPGHMIFLSCHNSSNRVEATQLYQWGISATPNWRPDFTSKNWCFNPLWLTHCHLSKGSFVPVKSEMQYTYVNIEKKTCVEYHRTIAPRYLKQLSKPHSGWPTTQSVLLFVAEKARCQRGHKVGHVWKQGFQVRITPALAQTGTPSAACQRKLTQIRRIELRQGLYMRFTLLRPRLASFSAYDIFRHRNHCVVAWVFLDLWSAKKGCQRGSKFAVRKQGYLGRAIPALAKNVSLQTRGPC